MAIKKLFVIIYFVCVATLLSGCIALIGDFANKADQLIGLISNGNQSELTHMASGDSTNLDDEQSLYSEFSILPYYNEEICYTGEIYDTEDNICTIPITCEGVYDCIQWGNQLVHEIEQQFGGFQEFYGFYDYSYEYYDEESYGEELYDDEHIYNDANERSYDDEQYSFLDEYDEEIVATYKIENYELVLPGELEDEGYYEWFWDEFRWIIPSEELWMLESFTVFNDDELVAYVVQEKDDLERWNLAINLNTNIRYHDSVSTHIHEFAHLLFLNSKQVNPYKRALTCYSDVYIEDKGCPYKDSYIIDYIERFGLDYEQEYDETKFVSEYASSNILEDMAETFYMFALTKKPAGDTIAEQKVLFFYEYDELVYLRANLLSRVATYMYRVL